MDIIAIVYGREVCIWMSSVDSLIAHLPLQFYFILVLSVRKFSFRAKLRRVKLELVALYNQPCFAVFHIRMCFAPAG